MPFMEENKVIDENTNNEQDLQNDVLPVCEQDDALSLDTLALEPETIEDTHESAEESADYASFLASYNALMADRLAMARSVAQESESQVELETSPDEETEKKSATPKSAETPAVTENSELISESDEVEVIVKQDIEFHKEIVDKADRVNAEDYIVLAPKKEEPAEELSAEYGEPETVAPSEEAAEVTHSDSYEEYEEAAQIAPETLEYDPNQISMMLGQGESPKERRDPTRYDEGKPRIIDHIFDVVEMLVLTLAAAIVITSIFFRFSFVDGHSMDKTLNDGDTLIISNLFYTPDYGDIVVVEYENNIHEVKPLIKRVIGLPGDVITINSYGDVYRNGELLDESAYIFIDNCTGHLPSGEWHVGEDEIFIMGDHRDNSKDSRDIGPVKISSIIGHAVFRLFPLKDIGTIN